MNEPTAQPICHRCGTRMMLARELPRLGPTASAIRVYLCTDCGELRKITQSEPDPT
jgi:hypothetical protein